MMRLLDIAPECRKRTSFLVNPFEMPQKLLQIKFHPAQKKKAQMREEVRPASPFVREANFQGSQVIFIPRLIRP